MKKLLSMLFVAVLVLGMMPMSANAAAEISVTQSQDKVTYTTDVSAAPVLTITNLVDYDVTVTIQVYDELDRQYIYNEQFVVPAGTDPLIVDGFAYKTLTRNGQINTYRYRVTTEGGFRANLYFAQTMHIDKNTDLPYYVQEHNAYYPRNTVSSFGPQFRIISPDFTKEWYMFTPIDLSMQGRQTFTLIASNMYEVGEVHVDVYGDTVNVTYNYFYEGQTEKIEKVEEHLSFFNDYTQALEQDVNTTTTQYAFGVPFSIANLLGGDTNVLMFIRNNLTYYRFPVPTEQLSRNYPNSEARNAQRGAMLGMMDPVEGIDLVNDHNYAK
ncbi:MAG: hypothetical protein GX781_07485 [Clostridiales bacterium]|nr:hypothetical protein [Clostridiales bacterium]